MVFWQWKNAKPFDHPKGKRLNKADLYKASLREIAVRLEKGGDLIADLGNVAAVLKKRHGFFWVGFYFAEGERLVLGPFQGTPACVYLPFGKGVCGTVALNRKTIVVPDVHAFPGHIACDPASKSEIAVPVLDQKGVLRAVLDADSDKPDAFDEIDCRGLESASKLLAGCWNP
jgi:L-methionine (R)-S-oxide reductase